MQGDTLAPFLFVIVLDYALRRAIQEREEELGFTLHPKRRRRVDAESICDLDFADDIVLLSNEKEGNESRPQCGGGVYESGSAVECWKDQDNVFQLRCLRRYPPPSQLFSAIFTFLI